MKPVRFAIVASILATQTVVGQRTTSDAPFRRFTPAMSPYAGRIVGEPFALVDDLKKIDPQVLAVFYSKVRPEYIANRGEKFNSTDVVTENLPARRFVLAGNASRIWFILYEHGGIAYHHDLVVFSKNGHWQIVAVEQGTIKGEGDFESLKQAIKAGQFFSLTGHPDF